MGHAKPWGPHRDASASVRRQREWGEYKKSLYVVSMERNGQGRISKLRIGESE